MTFDIEQYRSANYVLPLALTVFLVLLFIPAVISLFKHILSIIRGKSTFRQLFSFRLFGIIIDVLLLSVVLNPLIHGGLALRNETETDAVTSSGVIEEIQVLSVYSGQKYRLEDKTTFGARIQVDGELYTVMDAEPLSVGEHIRFVYLPKSHFVLEILDTD